MRSKSATPLLKSLKIRQKDEYNAMSTLVSISMTTEKTVCEGEVEKKKVSGSLVTIVLQKCEFKF